jgi:hypothetical protein
MPDIHLAQKYPQTAPARKNAIMRQVEMVVYFGQEIKIVENMFLDLTDLVSFQWNLVHSAIVLI